MRTFAIGDIHGCLTALDTLLSSLELDDEDRLIFLGDYIDRGPESRGVIERLMELSQSPQHVFIRGNHDDWMLRARYDREWLQSWWGVGGQETMESYDAFTLEEIPEAHFAWIEKTRLFFETDDHIFVHGAIGNKPPSKTSENWLLWRRVYDIPPHPSGKRVICGHTSQKSGLPLDLGHAVCIDTYCYGTGWLTALEVHSNEIWQADEFAMRRRLVLQPND